MNGSYFSRSVADRFDISKSLLHDAMKRVVSALNNVANRYIKWPVGDRVNEVKHRFSEIGSLPDVIGAIDGTHIPIPAPKVSLFIRNNSKHLKLLFIIQSCVLVSLYRFILSSIGQGKKNMPLHYMLCAMQTYYLRIVLLVSLDPFMTLGFLGIPISGMQ